MDIEKDSMETDPSDSNADAPVGETERLIWALLDGNIDREDAKRLEAILGTSDEARKNYLDSTLLHVELAEHFRQDEAPDEEPSTTPPGPPFLGLTGDSASGDVPIPDYP